VSEPELKKALERLAEEAGDYFGELLRAGAEIPFEIDQKPGESSPLYRYVPQTHKFIVEHAEGLRKLRSFAPACKAISAAGVAANFLEEGGLPVPSDEQRRAEQLTVAFMARLWNGCDEFTIDPERLERILREIEFGSSDAISPGRNVFCPLVGLQLPVTKLELATATIVRAEVTELPPDALRSEGMGRAAWEPQFVAVAKCLDEQQPAAVVNAQLRELITAMRLLRPGGVALGPHAWTQSEDGRWKRLATGAARPRAGGYVLTESDAIELADLTRALGSRPHREGPVGWAIARFELGCERETIFEGMSDYLLALRAILEGGGPAVVSLPMRIAALRAEPRQRAAMSSAIERALVLEHRVMGGAPASALDDDSLELAAEVEDHVRTILCDAARGELGGDLRVTADEILVADGLHGGDAVADMGATAEWEIPDPPGPGIRVFAAKDRSQPSTEGDPATRPDMKVTEEEEEDMQISDVVVPINPTDVADSRPGHSGRSPRPERSATERLPARELFPAPEATDWSIPELRFSRR
jgi:hypothetical protein